MRYWIEKCPYCGCKDFKSDVTSEKKFDTPIIVCSRCSNIYIHPERIEIGMLTEKEQKNFARKMLYSMLWRAPMFGLIPYAFAEALTQNSMVSIPIGIIVTSYLIYKSIVGVRRTMVEEIPKSEERLKQPGYREFLEKSGYRPRW